MGSEFLKENIKKKPIDKSKLVKRIIITVVSAVIFGIIATLTILVLVPFLRNRLAISQVIEKPNFVSFKEDEEEMSPEEMLADYMLQEAALQEELNEDETEINQNITPADFPLNEEQVGQILSQVSLDRTNYRQLATALTAYYRDLLKYMVTVTSSTVSYDWLDSTNDNENMTSGVIIANNQVDLLVLADVSQINTDGDIELTFYTGESVSANIMGIDADTNLAILSVRLSDVPSDINVEEDIAPLGSSRSQYVGLPVMAVGSPMGMSGSMSYGMINTPKTSIPFVDWYETTIQTDIYGSKNASGVLFNLQGQIIGVLTSNSNAGSDYCLLKAIGISELRGRIEKISNNQELVYLGITTKDVTDKIAQERDIPKGAYVLSVEMDSPAMRVGLQSGDIIVGIDDAEINNCLDYVAALDQKAVNDMVRISVLRKSQDEYIRMTFDMNISSR